MFELLSEIVGLAALMFGILAGLIFIVIYIFIERHNKKVHKNDDIPS